MRQLCSSSPPRLCFFLCPDTFVHSTSVSVVLRVRIGTEGPLSNPALLLIGGVNIGTRALLEIYLI
jgi:hypothetical protein